MDLACSMLPSPPKKKAVAEGKGVMVVVLAHADSKKA